MTHSIRDNQKANDPVIVCLLSSIHAIHDNFFISLIELETLCMYVFPICVLYIFFNIKVILVVSYNSYQKWANERREFNGAGVSLFINIIKYSSTFCTCWTYSFLSSSAAIFFHDCANFPWYNFSRIYSDWCIDEDFTL